RFRHLVKPGITGLAQVMYLYGASVEDARYKHRYDLYYIRHRSWYLDLKILLKTLRVAFTGEGV
ncbi:MAG TPA: sugar transferase, partial [Thiolinea sp.]|nr:sugar transferase [Thiolinea sp.]